MSDRIQWDGDMYRGNLHEEKQYEHYPVNEEAAQETASASDTSATEEEEPEPTSYQNSYQGNYQNPYQGNGYQQNQGYGQQTYQRNTYPGGGYHPQPKKQRPEKKPGGDSGIGKKFGLTITMALVFGLVASAVFQGANLLGNKYFHTQEESKPSLQSTPLVPQTDAAAGSNTSTTAAISGSVASVAKSAMPSVVAITSVSVQEIPNFFGGMQKYQGIGSGSGVIVGENDEELLIATNNHVVSDANELSVCFIGDSVASAQQTKDSLSQNNELDMEGAVSARIKGTDPSNDLAVISVKKSDIPEDTMAQLQIAQIGDSDSLEVGDQVVAIGNALGYGQSVTSGWVSALNRTVAVDESNNAEMIQTDAAINPGNSGGALLNMQGQLIGINSAKEAANAVEGMGYAIPITSASPILDELMSRETRDKVEEGKSAYLGIQVANLTDEAIQMYNMPNGAFVAEVSEGSAAEAAGMKKGDIISKLDGQSVTSRDDLLEKLTYYAKGETVEIVINRADNGEYVAQTLTVTFDARPAGE